MSTISTVQEAYEALCAGEYFQVEGQIINPADIVKVDRSPNEPRFYLSDGSVVQHKKYEAGDVGDLLAEALQVATRGGQSQRINPRAFAFQRENYIYEGKLDWYRNLQFASYQTGQGMRIAPDGKAIYILDSEDTSPRIQKYEIPVPWDVVGSMSSSGNTLLAQHSISGKVSKTAAALYVTRNEQFVYVADSGTLYKWEMTTPGDLSSISYVGNGNTASGAINFNYQSFQFAFSPASEGTVAFCFDPFGNLQKFEMTTAYDLGTSSKVQQKSIAGDEIWCGQDEKGNPVLGVNDGSGNQSFKVSTLPNSDLNNFLPVDENKKWDEAGGSEPNPQMRNAGERVYYHDRSGLYQYKLDI
jgi:hypothetical protein